MTYSIRTLQILDVQALPLPLDTIVTNSFAVVMVFRKRCVNFTAWTHKSQNQRAKHVKKYLYFRCAEAEEVSMLYLQSCADELSTEVSMLCNCPC